MTPALLYLLIAVGLIGTELLVMQFSVFWFLFFGLGALVTSLLSWVFPDISWFVSALVFLISSVGISIAFYPMIKKLQSKKTLIAGNDAIGQSVEVTKPISANKKGKVSWSGTEWPAQLADGQDTLAIGDNAVIQKIEGIRLIVSR